MEERLKKANLLQKIKDSKIKKYDKNGNVKSTKVTKPNGSSKTYDKGGKLIKKTEITNY